MIKFSLQIHSKHADAESEDFQAELWTLYFLVTICTKIHFDDEDTLPENMFNILMHNVLLILITRPPIKKMLLSV